jgi:hypothetical protein
MREMEIGGIPILYTIHNKLLKQAFAIAKSR